MLRARPARSRLVVASVVVHASLAGLAACAPSSSGGSSGAASSTGLLAQGATAPAATSTPAPVSSPAASPAPASPAAPAPAASPSSAPASPPPSAPASSPAPSGPAPLVVAGWLPSWSGSTGVNDVLANVGHGLDECNAFWYGVKSDGSLSAVPGARDASLVAAVHAAGRIIVPTCFDVGSATASKTVMASPTLRAALEQALLDELGANDYDGIDLDFESLGHASRADFSAWVADLAGQLHARGKILSIAIWPKKSEPGGGGAAALDYAALGAAVDRFKLMTYGDHGGWSGPGPIGALDTGATYVGYALAQGVPASKVFLGIPFYGYDWPSGGKGKAVTWSQAQHLIARATSGPTFDAARGESTFGYTDASGVAHTVWFQDDQAVAAKEALAKSLGIAGVACWSIGHEGPDFFTVLDQGR